jgi:hypothetical protein
MWESKMSDQKELFEVENGDEMGPNITVNRDRGIPTSVILTALAFLFSVLAFLMYMLWDFGIAGRVVLFLILILVIVHSAIYIAKMLFDSFRWRK